MKCYRFKFFVWLTLNEAFVQVTSFTDRWSFYVKIGEGIMQCEFAISFGTRNISPLSARYRLQRATASSVTLMQLPFRTSWTVFFVQKLRHPNSMIICNNLDN